jgi:hypothetical protein
MPERHGWRERQTSREDLSARPGRAAKSLMYAQSPRKRGSCKTSSDPKNYVERRPRSDKDVFPILCVWLARMRASVVHRN